MRLSPAVYADWRCLDAAATLPRRCLDAAPAVVSTGTPAAPKCRLRLRLSALARARPRLSVPGMCRVGAS